MMRNYSNHSVEALHALLQDVMVGTAEGLRKGAEILAELKSKGEFHPWMREGTLARYQDIADGKLSPLAALTFPGLPMVLDRITGLPIEQQDELARTGQVAVAELDAKGKVVETKKPIVNLVKEKGAQVDLDRVFVKDTKSASIRPVEQQAKILRQEESRRQTVVTSYAERIRVDTVNTKLIFGNMRVGVDELRDPLRKLGWGLVRLDSGTSAAWRAKAELKS